jgi:hypothetical protein
MRWPRSEDLVCAGTVIPVAGAGADVLCEMNHDLEVN